MARQVVGFFCGTGYQMSIEYIPVLMSAKEDGSEINDKEKGKLYLDWSSEGLRYEVVGLDDQSKKGLITWGKFRQAKFPDECIAELKETDNEDDDRKGVILKHYLGAILKITSEAGHTHRNGYADVFATLKGDIEKRLGEKVSTFKYDGCNLQGKFLSLGGLNANGTGEVAKKFVKDLKDVCLENKDEKIKVNMVAHSRGCISVFKAVQKIQADPYLSRHVEVVLDLRDPVPGNVALTTKMRNPSAVSVKISKLENCSVVKQANITLSDRVFNRANKLGFNSIIPAFSPVTTVEIDVLPMKHDGQERGQKKENNNTDEKYKSNIVELGYQKSLGLILENSEDKNQHKEEIEKSVGKQILSYEKINDELNNKPSAEERATRSIHYDGKIIRSARRCDYLNSRHVKLSCMGRENQVIPPSIRFTVAPPDNISKMQAFYMGSMCPHNGSKYNWDKIASLVKRIDNQIEKIDQGNDQGRGFARSAKKLMLTLFAEVDRKTDEGGKKESCFKVEGEYAYQCLKQLETTLTSINSQDALDKKRLALTSYEKIAKRSSSGWAKFGKCLAGFLVLATAIVVGIVVGAAIGAAATSWTGPGAIVGAIAGGYAGAKITAATAGAIGVTAGGGAGLLGAIGFLSGKKEKVKKDSSEFLKRGKSLAHYNG